MTGIIIGITMTVCVGSCLAALSFATPPAMLLAVAAISGVALARMIYVASLR